MIQKSIISFRNVRRAVAAPAALLLTAYLAQGGTLYVTTGGNDASSGASWALAKRSITNAMVAKTGTVVPGVGTIASVAQFGSALPSGYVDLNDRGQVVFAATLTDGCTPVPSWGRRSWRFA